MLNFNTSLCIVTIGGANVNKFLDKVVLITGGNQGIGSIAAKKFCKEGAHCFIASQFLDKCEAYAAQLSADGYMATGAYVDVTDSESVKKLVIEIENRFGHIDILINMAGICTTTKFNEVTPEQWNKVMNVNAFGTFYITQQVIESMKRTDTKGVIVNAASIAAKTGAGAVGVDYSASKASIVNITISAATYGARYGIRVNAVAPGPIATDMTSVWDTGMCEKLVKTIPLGRTFGKAEDVAEAIVFLASPKAKYISGEILDINGAAYCD